MKRIFSNNWTHTKYYNKDYVSKLRTNKKTKEIGIRVSTDYTGKNSRTVPGFPDQNNRNSLPLLGKI